METLVASGARVIDGCLDKGTAEACAASGGVDEEALHLEAALVEGSQGDAAVVAGNENELVFAGQGGEFLLERLEAEVDIDVGLIVAKEAFNHGLVGGEAGRADVKLKVTWVQRPKIPFNS